MVNLTSTAAVSGRIIEASAEDFVAECPSEAEAPPVGSLVVTIDGDRRVFGAVALVSTSGVDPSRPIVPHGEADEDLESVMRRNPHLPMLLRTTCTANILAHEEEDRLYFRLPEMPPPLFARIALASVEQHARIVSDPGFLEPLLRGDDALVAAFLRRASSVAPGQSGFMLETGRRLVPLLSADPERLTRILRQIRPSEAMR
jgi:hypothetical protein